MNKNILGVDIGGSHITSCVVDLDLCHEIKSTWSRSGIDSSGSITEIIDGWALNIEHSILNSPGTVEQISIAMPGPMDYKKGICLIHEQSKYASLYNINIKQKLADRLNISTTSIKFSNDAACFLKGEMYGGSLKNVENAIGLTLGTGLGTSHSLNGQTFDSDLWNMPFLKGIAEDYLSTDWFISRFYEISGISIKDVKDLVENHCESPYFKVVFSEFSMNLAKFIHRFIRKKMPIAAVIGGNIAHAERFFLAETRAILAKKMGYSFPIECSVLGEEAALLGAAVNF